LKIISTITVPFDGT